MIEKVCKSCFRTFPIYNTAMTICALCAINRYDKPKKPIKKRGKEYHKYEKFRREVAIPYLDNNYGRICSHCGTGDNLDIDHIKKRGSHPEMKYDLNNLRYLCRSCHRDIT